MKAPATVKHTSQALCKNTIEMNHPSVRTSAHEAVLPGLAGCADHGRRASYDLPHRAGRFVGQKRCKYPPERHVSTHARFWDVCLTAALRAVLLDGTAYWKRQCDGQPIRVAHSLEGIWNFVTRRCRLDRIALTCARDRAQRIWCVLAGARTHAPGGWCRAEAFEVRYCFEAYVCGLPGARCERPQGAESGWRGNGRA